MMSSTIRSAALVFWMYMLRKPAPAVRSTPAPLIGRHVLCESTKPSTNIVSMATSVIAFIAMSPGYTAPP